MNFDLAVIKAQSNNKAFDFKQLGCMVTLVKVFLAQKKDIVDLKALSNKLVQVVSCLLSGSGS